MSQIKNQRSGKDRRIASRNVTLPLRDHEGITISKDRRIHCDRRTDGMVLTETKLSQQQFNSYFKQFSTEDA